jgi:hypothetical protein
MLRELMIHADIYWILLPEPVGMVLRSHTI